MEANPNKLSIKWSKREKDFIINYPRRCDGALISHVILSDRLGYCLPSNEHKYPRNFIIENLVKELESRGYDITTLKFSVDLKENKK